MPLIYHSDGRVYSILDDLVACGFNAIHPIEPKAMDIELLKQSIGDRLCLMGNIDLSYTLTRGKPHEVEDEVTTAPRDSLRELREIKAELLGLRRAIWPHRETVHELIRGGNPLNCEDTRVYLRDCYDHTMQIIDVVEVLRETCADLRDYSLSQIGQTTNDIMKVLTIISTTFMPISFLAGLYGMNFRYMPELESRLGYPILLAVMLLLASGLLFFFWRRGWFSS